MAEKLRGVRVAFLVAPEGVEQVELTSPWAAVREAGGTPSLVSTEPGLIQAFHHLDRGDTFEVDVTVADTSVANFDALVLPGGVANPDYLRTQDDAVDLVRDFYTAGKPIAAICHAPWVLIEADLVRGRTLTSWPSLATDLRNAGATWVDEIAVICEVVPSTLLTSRKPADLPAFGRRLVELFSRVPAGSGPEY